MSACRLRIQPAMVFASYVRTKQPTVVSKRFQQGNVDKKGNSGVGIQKKSSLSLPLTISSERWKLKSLLWDASTLQECLIQFKSIFVSSANISLLPVAPFYNLRLHWAWRDELTIRNSSTYFYFSRGLKERRKNPRSEVRATRAGNSAIV